MPVGGTHDTSGDEGGTLSESASLEAVFSAIMVGAVGWRLKTFIPDLESVTVYLEHMELYFSTNKVKRKILVFVFLNLLGRETSALLQNLVLPVKPTEKSLDELMDALKGHFEPNKLVTAAWFQFHQWQQQADESVSTYLAKLGKWQSPVSLGIPCRSP